MKLAGSATNIVDTRALLGEFTASHEHAATLKSIIWSAMGHGDVTFTVSIDFDETTGVVTPGKYHDRSVQRQALGEDTSPIAALTIPKTGTVRFLARAVSGADSAGFLAEILLEG